MSCDHQLMATHVIALLEGTLPPVLRERCEAVLQHCPHCRDVFAQAQQYRDMATQWQDEEVPRWNRARHLVQPQRRQGNTPWLSWTALAASLAAIFLVVSKTEVSTENGLMISFGGGLGEARVQQLVTAAVASSTAAQTTFIDTRLSEFTEQQTLANRLLYAEWENSTRNERQQELGLLLTGWQSQRFQDQQAVASRLNELTNDQLENNQYLNALMRTVAAPGRNGL
ncbi:MAG: hypothetical protein V4603_12135 [Pseudomonadota bacterium]